MANDVPSEIQAIGNTIAYRKDMTQIPAYLERITERQDLKLSEAQEVMDQITKGEVSDMRISALLAALKTKGETSEEIAAFAMVLRSKASSINPEVNGKLTDTAGTGAAKLKTINISTISAFVAAGAGVPMAKHGGRSVTSICGSADLIEALGAKLVLSPQQVKEVIEKVGFGFLFAPTFHPAFKYAVVPRREMGIRTVFNLLGPLTNPAGAKCQLVGVYQEDVVDRTAGALQRLGTEKALVVYGLDGLDELSTLGKTIVAEINKDQPITKYEIRPEDFGLKLGVPESIQGSTPAKSAEITREILSGKGGPMSDIILLNSAATIYVGGKAKSIQEGMELASETIQDGKALGKLEDFVRMTNEF